MCCSPWGCNELDTTEWLKWTKATSPSRITKYVALSGTLSILAPHQYRKSSETETSPLGSPLKNQHIACMFHSSSHSHPNPRKTTQVELCLLVGFWVLKKGILVHTLLLSWHLSLGLIPGTFYSTILLRSWPPLFLIIWYFILSKTASIIGCILTLEMLKCGGEMTNGKSKTSYIV